MSRRPHNASPSFQNIFPGNIPSICIGNNNNINIINVFVSCDNNSAQASRGSAPPSIIVGNNNRISSSNYNFNDSQSTPWTTIYNEGDQVFAEQEGNYEEGELDHGDVEFSQESMEAPRFRRNASMYNQAFEPQNSGVSQMTGVSASFGRTMESAYANGERMHREYIRNSYDFSVNSISTISPLNPVQFCDPAVSHTSRSRMSGMSMSVVNELPGDYNEETEDYGNETWV